MNNKQIIEIVGVIVVVLSLIFVGYEIRQNTIVARSEAYQTAMFELSNMTQNIAFDEFGRSLLAKLGSGGLSFRDLAQDEVVGLSFLYETLLFSWGGIYFSVREGILPEEMLDTIARSAIVSSISFGEWWLSGRSLIAEDFAIFIEGKMAKPTK